MGLQMKSLKIYNAAQGADMDHHEQTLRILFKWENEHPILLPSGTIVQMLSLVAFIKYCKIIIIILLSSLQMDDNVILYVAKSTL
jgi:hypothetical protein